MDSIVQGSEEWQQLRIGKVTASRIADVLARTKTGWGASRANYAAELVAERLTGSKAETFKSDAMDRGNELEASARLMYEFINDVSVDEVPFVLHPTIAESGASPDGLIGEVGLVEIKCPNTSTHIATLQGGTIKGVYCKQMQWQMECTGREWCDFVSFDPRLPASMQLHIQRVQRDEDWLSEARKHVTSFLKEIEETCADLVARYETQEKAA